MGDELNLTLPQKEPPKDRGGLLTILIAVAILLGGANLAVLLLGNPGTTGTAPGLDTEGLREVALKLERQELGPEAVSAWREVLVRPDLDDEERAKIWYRVGKLHQDEGSYGEALDAFYRCEHAAQVPGLRDELSIRVEDCLARLGSFSSMQHELKGRTALSGEGAEEKIVAEIGPRKITEEDLEHRIEQIIDLQMEQFASFLPLEERNRQKEALLRRFASPEARRMELRRYIMEEILFRKAREDKLHEDDGVREFLRITERQILADMEMRRELASEIKITESDLKNHYEARKGDFVQKDEETGTEKQLSFEEARAEVYRALRGEKEREVQENLLTALEERYDVVIHEGALGGTKGKDGE